MRLAIQIIAFALMVSAASLVGCGPQDTDPKAVNVKEDKRIKRASDGGGGGEKQEQTNIK